MQDFLNIFSQTLSYVYGLPVWAQIGVIMGAALFGAFILLPFISGIVHFLTRKTETDIDDRLIKALNAPLFYFMLLVGASFSLPLISIPSGVASALSSIIQTLFILVVAQALLRVVRIVLEGASDTKRIAAINEQTLPLFANIALILAGAGGLYAFFIVWGIDITAWLASAGIIGIAVGFAAKDTLSNIISGIFILADKPYSIGDFVELGSGETGIVDRVGLRSTRIITFSDEEVTIPNTVIANEAITNKSTGPDQGRVNVDVGVAYGSDVQKVQEILLAIAHDNELVLDEPEPSVRFTEFADSSLNFRLICRVRDPLNVYGTKSDIRFEVDKRFREANIEIPFPQRDVHMKQ